MPVLVNVEHLTFEDLIPHLKESDYVEDCINDVGEEKVYQILEEKFNQLQRGEHVQDFTLFGGLTDALDSLGRELLNIDGMTDDYMIVPIKEHQLTDFLEKLRNGKLSKVGRTNFTVENIDWAFVMEALDYYKKYVDEAEFADNSIMTKDFVQERVKSALETFTIKSEK